MKLLTWWISYPIVSIACTSISESLNTDDIIYENVLLIIASKDFAILISENLSTEVIPF